jgi:hypothetical protein
MSIKMLAAWKGDTLKTSRRCVHIELQSCNQRFCNENLSFCESQLVTASLTLRNVWRGLLDALFVTEKIGFNRKT